MDAYAIKALARDLDKQRRTKDRSEWPQLAADVRLLEQFEWSGKDDSCLDCRRSKRYGHQCSCPVRLALKYLRPLMRATDQMEGGHAVGSI